MKIFQTPSPPLFDCKSRGAIGKSFLSELPDLDWTEFRRATEPLGRPSLRLLSRALVRNLTQNPVQTSTVHQRSTNQIRPLLHRHIRLLPHIALFPNPCPAPLPLLSLSPIHLSSTEVNLNPDPYTLLKFDGFVQVVDVDSRSMTSQVSLPWLYPPQISILERPFNNSKI
jgi:hypothetical protein